MLLRFRVQNHASLRDEQELSLVAQDRQERRAEAVVPGAGELVTVPVAVVYGPNASGKSNVIDALRWMRGAVLASYQRWDPSGGVPRRPFLFRRDPEAHPTEFQVDFVIDRTRYEFGFSVDDEKILGEWLNYFPEGRARRLYERNADCTVTFGRWLTGRRKTIADSLRPNSLFISVAAAQGHQQLSRIFRWFRFGLTGADDADYRQRLDHTLHLISSDKHGYESKAVVALLSFADLGAAELAARETEETDAKEFRKIQHVLRETLGENRIVIESSHYKDIEVVHRTAEGEFALPLGMESSGTRTWIGLLGVAVSALVRGAVLCVDELDARLHPHLVDAFVGLFVSPEVNKYGAQLIFSSHDVTLLGRNARTELFRDQIWLTEKDPDTLATRLFPLTEFRVRETDNFEPRYLVGKYGAVPYLDEDVPRLFGRLFEREDVNEGETASATTREASGEEPLSHLL